jgi:hypothetical protein
MEMFQLQTWLVTWNTTDEKENVWYTYVPFTAFVMFFMMASWFSLKTVSIVPFDVQILNKDW